MLFSKDGTYKKKTEKQCLGTYTINKFHLPPKTSNGKELYYDLKLLTIFTKFQSVKNQMFYEILQSTDIFITELQCDGFKNCQQSV